MSNVCSNRIEIIGDKDVIARMFDLVKSEARDWGVEPNPNKSEEENRILLGLEFDFNKVLPYTEEYARWILNVSVRKKVVFLMMNYQKAVMKMVIGCGALIIGGQARMRRTLELGSLI